MVAEGDEHWPRDRGKLKRLAKLISRVLAIKVVFPGGALIVLACLLTGRGRQGAGAVSVQAARCTR